MRSTKTIALLLTLCLLVPLMVSQAGLPDQEISPEADGLNWTSAEPYAGAKLTILGPDGLMIEQSYGEGEPLFWTATQADYPDGEYSYELVIEPVVDAFALEGGRAAQAETVADEPKVVYGEFALHRGKLTPVGGDYGLSDILHLDDTIVIGSLCVGFDCNNGESFGFATIRLKENNLRIHFQDTSNTGSFPSRDWGIVINDSANGGKSYFAIQDADSSRYPFLVEGGAPANSLYVEDYGRVGFGTSTPVVELHVKDSDTPTLRLEQDSSGGWSPQTWDVAGNESNFFIRDATNGSKLSFRIQPGTPSSTMCLKSDGNVGIGTWSPSHDLEVEATGEDSSIVAQRTDGATAIMMGASDSVYLGSLSKHPVHFMANNQTMATLGVSGTLSVNSGFGADASMHGSADSAHFGTEEGSFVKVYVGDTVVGRFDGNGNLALTGQVIGGVPLSAMDGDEPIKADDSDEVTELKAQVAAQGAQIAQLEERLAALEALLLANSAPASMSRQ